MCDERGRYSVEQQQGRKGEEGPYLRFRGTTRWSGSRHKKSHGSFAEVEGSCNHGASGGHLSGWPSYLESAAPRLISTELARTWAEGWLSMQSLELLKKSNRIYGMLSCEICTNLLPYFCHKNCEFKWLMHPYGFTTQKSIKSYFEFSYF